MNLKRTVRFSDAPDGMRPTIARSEISQTEKEAAWYTLNQRKHLRKELSTAIRALWQQRLPTSQVSGDVLDGANAKEHCFRGLEALHSQRAMDERDSLRISHIRAVLAEQQIQRTIQSSSNTEKKSEEIEAEIFRATIANISISRSLASTVLARKLAMEDANEVEKELLMQQQPFGSKGFATVHVPIRDAHLAVEAHRVKNREHTVEHRGKNAAVQIIRRKMEAVVVERQGTAPPKQIPSMKIAAIA